MRKGVTFIEMLVVIGIIIILLVASSAGYVKYAKSGETAKCQELVRNTATALTVLFNNHGFWPKVLREGGGAHGALLDETRAYPLAHYGLMTLSSSGGKLSGYNRFGILTPWAAAVVKRKGSSARLTDRVPSGGTVQDHILRYAIDLDGDGVIPDVEIGGKKMTFRAIAVVWCCGRDGKIRAWTDDGRGDDVYSFTAAEIKDAD